MRARIFLKLVLSFFAVILAVTVLLDFSISGRIERTYTETLRQGLEQKALLLSDWLGELPAGQLAEVVERAARRVDARITVIQADGKVLADSEAAAGEMENHAHRPEFEAALRGQAGSSTRFSGTVRVNFLYVAIPLRSGPWTGGALRLAYPLAELERSIAGIRKQLALGSGLAVLAALLLSAVLAAPISRRLRRVVSFANAVAEGQLAVRMPVDGSDEVSLVMQALNRTADRLEEGFSRLAESSQQLEAVLEAMEDGVLAVDAGRRVVCANRALSHLLGRSVPTGLALEEAIRNPEIAEVMDHSLATGTPASVDLRFGAPVRWLKLFCSPMLAAAQQPSGVVAVLHDVTNVERLEKIRKDFVANVSHELRTPLTSIQGYAETLLESGMVPDAQSREFVEIIRRHAERMAKLTADLLTLSRIELGRHEFRFGELRIADAIHSGLQSVLHVAQARGVTLEGVDVPEDIEVLADSDAIHQVLVNLLDNALKYTPPGGRVTASVQVAGDAAEVCVADTGIGIAAEHLPRLFERFYRVDKARSRELGGTGLGLSIVKHIALAHGGEVRVESEPGRGSRFFFTLPLAATLVSAEVR